jgi:hypothetical protein
MSEKMSSFGIHEVWCDFLSNYRSPGLCTSMFPLPDPIEAILYYPETRGFPRRDLERHIGCRARVWEILNRLYRAEAKYRQEHKK